MEVLPFESLPLGFRFKPTDAELIDHYLRLKINGDEKGVSVIREVDVCKVEPWDLPDLSMIKSKDHEWFFFCPLDRKYPNGHRSNRATRAGYWKATGKDRRIVSRKMSLIGMKKTLVFYKGRAPKGQRTNWVIHEYRTTLAELDGTHHGQGAFVICRLFKKPEDKKQNANDDGYNCDEGEMHISSPTATNISHEDHPSDPALVQESPISDAHTVEQLAVSENFAVEGSDRITSEVLAPFQCPSNSNAYDSESQMEVEIIHEVDSQLDEALKHFYDPQHPPSPLHHVPVELGSANMVLTQIATSGCDNGEMQSQDGIYGKCSVSDFLDSVLIDPDDYHFDEIASEGTPIVDSPTREDPIFLQKNVFIESGSCSRSDVEGTYVQNGMPFVGGVSVCNLRDEYRGTVLPKQNADFADDNWFSDAALEHFLNAHSNLGEPSINILEKVDNDKKVESGIKIRTRPMRPIAPNFVQQGMANRRLRLQKRLQFTAQDHEAEPAGTEVSSLSTEDGEKSSADTGASPAPDNMLTGANREVRLVTRKKDKSKLTSILKENDQVCKTEESSSIGITKGVAQSSVTSLHMWRVIKIAVIFLAVALCAGITITLSCKLLL